MTESTTMRESRPGAVPRAGWAHRSFPLTDLPTWLMLALVAVGLPRTVLVDLGVLEPEGSLVYYVLALAPFAAWLGVAVVRTNRRPVADFLVLGLLYGLSLVLVHQVLWDAGSSMGHEPPASAVEFAERFDPSLHEVALRGYTSLIALGIGLGTGAAVALVAVVAAVVRARRTTRG